MESVATGVVKGVTGVVTGVASGVGNLATGIVKGDPIGGLANATGSIAGRVGHLINQILGHKSAINDLIKTYQALLRLIKNVWQF